MNAPLNYFLHGAGPAAQPTMILGWIFTGICIAVCLIIAILLGAAIWHKRDGNPQTINRGGYGLRWVGIGTGISCVILFAMAIYALIVLNDTATLPQKPGLTITVTGYDWWWKVTYKDSDPAKQFETANEIHIPIKTPILVKLKSADVIHAFWVPELAGKTQMIPGITNQQWLEADKPGIYRGQCTQFCGAQHAHMAFEVIAQTAKEFARWQSDQRSVAEAKNDEGEHTFEKNCASCHSVRGTSATGDHGPDLTHFASRRLLAASMLENNRGNLTDWVQHAQTLKPDSRMPNFDLPPQTLAPLIDYLEGLQ